MRSRVVKEGFFKNDILCSLSPWHRLLFEGLWMVADRKGLLEDRPKRIHADIFPYDHHLDIEPMLADLERLHFITRYWTEKGAMIAVVEFHSHQKPHIREAPSTLPGQDQASPRPEPDPVTYPPQTATNHTQVISSTVEIPRHSLGGAQALPRLDLGHALDMPGPTTYQDIGRALVNMVQNQEVTEGTIKAVPRHGLGRALALPRNGHGRAKAPPRRPVSVPVSVQEQEKKKRAH